MYRWVFDSPDGGQWTSEGGREARAEAAARAGASAALPAQDGWTTLQRVEAGGVTGEIVRGADGTLIRHETDPGAEHGWTERNVVTLPDGSAFQFRTEGQTQVVATGDGQEISRTVWTSSGPEPVATVQPAYAQAVPPLVKAVVYATTVLFGWMALRDSADQKAVASFRAFESDGSGLLPEGVTRIDREKVEQACPRLAEVQARLDDAVDRVSKNQPDLSPSQYGTAVHLDLANQIRALHAPNFIAEESDFKTSIRPARYGARGTVRVDVLENVNPSTVCVYDIKTGDEVVHRGRAREIVQAAKTNFPTATRIIVTEVKPGR